MTNFKALEYFNGLVDLNTKGNEKEVKNTEKESIIFMTERFTEDSMLTETIKALEFTVGLTEKDMKGTEKKGKNME